MNSHILEDYAKVLDKCKNGASDAVLHCAVLIAKDEGRTTSFDVVKETIAGLAEELRHKVVGDDTLVRLEQLCRGFREILGFEGNRDNYYDARNSCIDCVLERRTGIPVSLGLVMIEIGRHLGVGLEGVCFPGHFILKSSLNPETFVDPFDSVILNKDSCKQMLDKNLGVPLQPFHLEASSSLDFCLRLILNLKHLAAALGDTAKQKRYCDAVLTLQPLNIANLRERGELLAKSHEYGAAAKDFERYIRLVGPKSLDEETITRYNYIKRKLEMLH